MADFRTRVIQVRFSSGPIRYAGVVLFPPEVKRRLATLEAAGARSMELARQIIQRRCYRPPDLDALTCTAVVTMFDLRPFTDVPWIQDDGTKVFLTEAEQPLPSDWGWRW
jgi:hypothetical protein